jgi:hypothetical protein
MGITINGMMITAEASIQLSATGLMTSITGTAMTEVTGGIIMIN